MSESEQFAAAPPEDLASPVDEEDRLRPAFVDKVLDAVEAGDDETARRLVQPLHPADVADLIELARSDERESRQDLVAVFRLGHFESAKLFEPISKGARTAPECVGRCKGPAGFQKDS